MDNGDLVWNVRTESIVGGYHRSAVVVKDQIFVSLQENELICIDGKSGKELWSFKHEGDGKGLAAGQGLVFLNAGQIFAFDFDGNLIWKSQKGCYPEMAFITGKLIVSNDTGTMALSPKNGNVVWKNNLISRSPVICGAKVYACLQKIGRQEVEAIVTMSLADGKEINYSKIDYVSAFPSISTVVAGESIFIGKPWHGQVYCYGDKK